MQIKIVVPLILMSFIFVGCSSTPKQPPKPLVESVAVLPFDSESNNVDAPEIMQRLVFLALEPSDYNIIDIKTTNDILREAGIVDGGQLASMDPTKIAEVLNVHGLIYGNVESFGYKNLGIYNSREVNLELELIDGRSGEKLWNNAGESKHKDTALGKNAIVNNFKDGMKDRLIDTMLQNPLPDESKEATVLALRDLRAFRFVGFAEDEQSAQEKKAENIRDGIELAEDINKTRKVVKKVNKVFKVFKSIPGL